MADFKELHKDWKKAKESAKLVYDEFVKLNTDFSMAHEDVKFDVPPFPKFNLDLGPSLDDIEKKKNVDKNKIKANKAVTQYEKDIRGLLKAVEKIQPDKDDKLKAKKENVQNALVTYLGRLMEVRDAIEQELGKI